MGKKSGKIALVAGSTRGIGLEIARTLGLEGAHVIICSRKKENVDKALSDLKAEGISVLGMPCHIGDKSARKILLDEIKRDHGGLDILVCNAGVNPYYKDVLGIPESAYDKIMEVNVKSTFMLIEESVPLMQTKGGGSIVIISSNGGYQKNGLRSGIYEVSKTMQLAMIKALCPELAALRIRINCVAPGLIRTKFSENLLHRFEEKITASYPFKRIGQPNECAGITSFLCSDDASFITGETVVAAGGMHSRL